MGGRRCDDPAVTREDVRSVLRERLSTLDLDLVRSTLMLLEEALGQGDLRPVFEREQEGEQNRNS